MPTVATSQRGDQEFDFGPVLACGQVLRHEFTLRNPSDRPIGLIRASTTIPCCSGIGPLPRAIPPGGEIKVPVAIKTDGRTGLLRIGVTVETDSHNAPVHRFGVAVRLVPKFEILEDLSAGSLSIRQSGRNAYRVACRRKGSTGLRLPDEVTAIGPLAVAMKSAADETPLGGGIVEATREIDVDLLPAQQAGRRQGEIFFRWRDGGVRSRVVGWEVIPRVRVVPSGFVLDGSNKQDNPAVTVTADDRPIRILEIAGPLARRPDTSSEPKRRHHLTLAVDVSKAGPAGLSDITMTTDHPDQPHVAVT